MLNRIEGSIFRAAACVENRNHIVDLCHRQLRLFTSQFNLYHLLVYQAPRRCKCFPPFAKPA